MPELVWHNTPWHARLGLSWSTGSVPVVLILLLGAALGPSGLTLLTPHVLDVLDPVIPVAVAALGILAGLEFTRPASAHRWTLFAKANTQSMLTGTFVALGIWLVAPGLLGLDGSDAWVVSLVIGVGASMSAALPEVDPDRLRPAATRIRDLDAFLPTLVGAMVLAALHSPSPLASVALAAQAALLALAISAAAWLLLADTSPSTEQRVFSVAALLLVGGVADYLSLSALASGLLAGIFWGIGGGVARDCIERDVAYVRHPLVVLMLLTAGAQTGLSPSILALAGAYLLLRAAGKLAGGWLVRHTPGVSTPEGLGPSLLSPGVFGIAFALNAAPMIGPSGGTVLAATVLGTIGAQLLAAMWRIGEQPA
jgi:hypothetical protein